MLTPRASEDLITKQKMRDDEIYTELLVEYHDDVSYMEKIVKGTNADALPSNKQRKYLLD